MVIVIVKGFGTFLQENAKMWNVEGRISNVERSTQDTARRMR